MVRVVVASAKSGGKAVKRPWLGARLQAVTPEIAETLGLRLPTGALVANVTPSSPAARAGLKLSDLIVAIEGQTIDDPNAFDYRFATRPLGGTAQIDVQRGGKTVKLTIPLETAPDTGRDEIVDDRRARRSRARKVANISPAVADELRLDAQHRGRRGDRSRRWRAPPPASASRRATSSWPSTTRRSPRPAISKRRRARPARLWRIVVVRGGQQINVTLGG